MNPCGRPRLVRSDPDFADLIIKPRGAGRRSVAAGTIHAPIRQTTRIS